VRRGTGSLPLGEGGEFDRLRAIFATLGAVGYQLGDDCALLSVGGRTLALSIDLSLEGVHFRTAWLSFREIGWRATAAALSDLAADGATPLGVLVSLGVPGNRQRRLGNASPAVQIMTGVGAAARSVGARVLGGDLVRSPRYLVDVCVLGVAQRPVRRGVWGVRGSRYAHSWRGDAVSRRPCGGGSPAPRRGSPRDAGWHGVVRAP
jgi:thiamine-monophosphate kinase